MSVPGGRRESFARRAESQIEHVSGNKKYFYCRN